MAAFDYMTNSDMRQCLVHDYRELQIAREAGANKAVVVLAGSIVEAVLVDYLLAYGPSTSGSGGKKDPLEMDLSTVIDLCHKAGVLSDRTRDLCSAVRAYRNLIHPGRMVRLGEAVDANSASVASTVVEIVSGEVERAFGSRQGLTCEQLATKIESDPNALAIMPHLVGHFRGRSLQRLILEVLPFRYQAAMDDCWVDDGGTRIKRSYRACFEAAFASAPKALKRSATLRTLAIVREGAEAAVLSCDDVFLVADGFGCVSGRDRDTLRDHLLARLSEPSEFVLAAAKGIGPHLTAEDTGLFFQPLARTVSGGAAGFSKSQQLLISEYRRMSEQCRGRVLSMTESHIKFWNDKQMWDKAARMKTLMRGLDPNWIDADDDIPF